MGFHKALIRPAISWGGVALGGVARIPLIKRFLQSRKKNFPQCRKLCMGCFFGVLSMTEVVNVLC